MSGRAGDAVTALRSWWNRLLGRSRPEPPPARPPARSPPPKPVGTLELVDTPQRDRHARRRGAGFDPYANDAGFSKPRGWERVDRD